MGPAEPSADGRSPLRRVGSRIAAALLVVLVSSAVYAPFLANDRPLLIRAVDRAASTSALESLSRVAASWNERLLAAANAHDDEGALADALAGLEQELRALELRLATLRRFAPSDDVARQPIVDLERLARAWTEAAFRDARRAREAPEPDVEPANERYAEASRVQALARALQESHAGLELRARTWSPLLGSLEWSEWAITFAWTVSLVLAARRASRRSFALGLAASLVLAALARAGFAPAPALATPAIKEGIDTGAIVLERAWFAPVPFGPAETNLSEDFRPPTWSAAAEIDEFGRRARDDAAPSPVAVRHGEPARNSWRRHPLGTDSLGRDVLSRLIWGGRVSLAVGFASVALAVLLGTLAGGLAGYFRGRLDAAILAVIAVLQSFPAFFLILVAVALLPARGLHPQTATVLVIGAVGWTGIARLVRAECLRTSALEYVLAARTLGFSHARVLALHVLPNSVAPVFVAAAFAVTTSILIESATSFLGFGVRPPTPSWGAVLRESQSSAHWWILVFPGLAVFVTCLACNRIGDALRDALDPREAS
jgi:ABC-type dipeptide/oligopeptide/nickel transport system permease subunit